MKKINKYNSVFCGFILFLLSTFPVCSQVVSMGSNYPKQDSIIMNFGKTGHAVIKGKTENYGSETIKLALTNYLDSEGHEVKVQKNGSFEKTLDVSNSQGLILYLQGEAIVFTIKAGDTLEVSWDEQDFDNSFNINSKNNDRHQQLQIQWQLFQKIRAPFMSMIKGLYEKPIPSYEKYKQINEMYNRSVEVVLAGGRGSKAPIDELLTGQYFLYYNTLMDFNLADKYSLEVNRNNFNYIPSDSTWNSDGKLGIHRYWHSILDNQPLHKRESESWFAHIEEYRSFLNNFFHKIALAFNQSDRQTDGGVDFSQRFYHLTKGCLQSQLIQDWVIAENLTTKLRYGQYKAAVETYHAFIEKVQTPYFRKELDRYFFEASQLKPGSKAPDFTLMNELGEEVSLSEFRGKVVYLDFWGVGCGPCIYEIKEYARQLHEKYAGKDLVFLNICVDTDETGWKTALKKYDMKGVNLLAEGKSQNPVCKAYNVRAIPRYIIIGKDGYIINNHALRPSRLLSTVGENELDKAVKEIK